MLVEKSLKVKNGQRERRTKNKKSGRKLKAKDPKSIIKFCKIKEAKKTKQIKEIIHAETQKKGETFLIL